MVEILDPEDLRECGCGAPTPKDIDRCWSCGQYLEAE